MPIALFALTISAYAIGTAEFVLVGIIPIISADLSVSVPSAGLLVSLYALGVAVGAPLLTAATGKMPRKTLLLCLMAVFTLSNLYAWQAPGFVSLIVARIITGMAHGVFYSIASTIAASLVPREKATSAIAIMFTGLTVALVTGVPLGTFIAQHLGWRATFFSVSVLGMIAFAGSFLLIPRGIKKSEPAPVRFLIKVLTTPQLILAYSLTAIGYGGSFITFTYLASTLEEISGFSTAAVSGVMLVYGFAAALGNLYGGRISDKHGPINALKIIFLLLSLVLFALYLTASNSWLMLVTTFVWGAAAFANVPVLQYLAVRQAEKFVPEAVDVASGLNISAFNIGIAGGTWIGGLVVIHFGLLHTTWLAGVVVFFAFLLSIFAGALEKREISTEAAY
ncbi:MULTISPECIES: MFS transporter [Klebsiella]|uniref:MFS transporter n=1 Tax=Klebsiella TaxID=570 RepID=UPI0010330423|nr:MULTISPECIES: MFS transporter [Klebsiella]MBM7152533.1 MFS transporter [Klebsiella variicola]MCW9490352.1 MFS transporter [Klebsiella michiganensis]